MPASATSRLTSYAIRRRRLPWLLTGGRGAAIGAIALVIVLMVGLLWQSAPVIRHSGLDYLIGGEWFYRLERFGILPMIYGSAVVSLVALLLAVPLGLATAVLMSEYLPPRLRLAAKTAVELLAGIPSVVYGLLGVLWLREWMQDRLEPFDPISGDSLLTAGVLLGVMVLPTVTTLADDALRGVSGRQRAAARGLGLTRAETILGVVLPQARAGLVAAVLLGLGRAVGETIAVFLVVGRQDNQLPGSPWDLEPWIQPGQTLTSKLGGAETFIAWGDPLHWSAIAGLAAVLLLGTVVINLAAHLLRGRPAAASA